jgi:long-chain acyl-CoA synthetase
MTKPKQQWIPQNLGDMFLTSAELRADNEVLRYKKGHHYESLSYFELKSEVMALAQALITLGFKLGDRILLISENRPEWVITDLALQLIGGVTVPVHEVLSAAQLSGIIEEIKPKAIFFSEKVIEDKLLEIAKDIAKVEHLVSFARIEDTNFEKLVYFKTLINGTEVTESDLAAIVKRTLSVKPDDLASIIYTSGTTGHLKGVKLTHENFVQDVVGIIQNVPIFPTDKFFSVLPLSHVFERTAGYYLVIYAGGSIGYCLDLATLSAEIQEQKPTIVLAVPRLFEKIYEKVQAKANKSVAMKLIFKAAFATKKSSPLYPLFDKLVFSKVKDNFGGNIRFFVSGGAALPIKIGQFFQKVDLTILEGYGLTETSPVIAVNSLKANKFGTVGIPLPNLKVKISDKDEVLVKGPTVMKGYLREEDNKEILTKDGWLRTGDLGFIDDRGFLTLTGRIKDLLVLTTGKKIAPVPIENALESSVYIEQAMVVGDGHKHIVALIVPNFGKLTELLGVSSRSKLLKMEEVMNLIGGEAVTKTANLSSIEHVIKFVLLAEPFSIESGELTPKLSLRRHIVLANNKIAIEKLYL